MISTLVSANSAFKPLQFLLTFVNSAVFLILDFLEAFLCVIYRYLDEFLEGKSTSCYCGIQPRERENVADDGENELSDTLFGRENVIRRIGFLRFPGKLRGFDKSEGDSPVNRWSDCGCASCVSWMKNGDKKLHVVVQELSPGGSEKPAENIIFLHGFLSSSSYWTETVFLNLSETAKLKYRLFAVDLLGFGKSPKPMDCLYTLKDHLERIEESVIHSFDLNSFHLVAHSMGCIIALALAAKYPNSVKTITLVSPPYFSAKNGAAMTVLKKLAAKRLWPPLLFGCALMSWYEHLGRCVCFILCRNHRIWESIFRLVKRIRDIDSMTIDIFCHTHRSAWHSMHNVIYGGAKLVDGYLDVLIKAGIKIHIFHGDKDVVAPIECSYNLKNKVIDADFNVVRNVDHQTIILGREKDFTIDLEHIWA